jgi:hypothetical protein
LYTDCFFFYLKGLVSRDLLDSFLVSFNRFEVPTHMEWALLLLQFRLAKVSILHLGVVSLLCEWSWDIRLSAATVVAPSVTVSPRRRSFKCCFGGIILKMETVPVRDSLQPRTGTVSFLDKIRLRS